MCGEYGFAVLCEEYGHRLSSHADVWLVDPRSGEWESRACFAASRFRAESDLRATRVGSRCGRLRRSSCGFDSRLPGRKVGTVNKRCGEAVHTDVAQHVHLVGNSGRQQEICALKIWRERSELEFPSFLLELATLRALESERFGQLAENVHCVLRYLGSKFESAVIRMPANSDNIVSRDLSEKAKKSVAKAARDAIYQENWEKILH